MGATEPVCDQQARGRVRVDRSRCRDGLATVSLRYFNAAGALIRDGGTSIGERHDPETHLIPNALRVAAGTSPALVLFGDDYPTPDGTCVRDYIHIADLAEAHLLALDAAVAGEHRVYNLGNGTGFSNRVVVETVRAVTGCCHRAVVRRAGRTTRGALRPPSRRDVSKSDAAARTPPTTTRMGRDRGPRRNEPRRAVWRAVRGR